MQLVTKCISEASIIHRLSYKKVLLQSQDGFLSRCVSIQVKQKQMLLSQAFV